MKGKKNKFSKLENFTTFLRHKFQNYDGYFITILVIDTTLDLYLAPKPSKKLPKLPEKVT